MGRGGREWKGRPAQKPLLLPVLSPSSGSVGREALSSPTSANGLEPAGPERLAAVHRHCQGMWERGKITQCSERGRCSQLRAPGGHQEAVARAGDPHPPPRFGALLLSHFGVSTLRPRSRPGGRVGAAACCWGRPDTAELCLFCSLPQFPLGGIFPWVWSHTTIGLGVGVASGLPPRWGGRQRQERVSKAK